MFSTDKVRVSIVSLLGSNPGCIVAAVTLEPLLPPKIKCQRDAYCRHYTQYGEVSVAPVQLWHIKEVHAINAGKEGQWNEDGGDECQ